jgi:CheY-like chemotaxis protein/HPt (histidine-containing phosphotransfer) domain-containing protein
VSTTRRYGGTGLGLSIVKRLTELMGGTLSVRSQHQQGTSVTLSIPFGLGADPASAAPRVVGERLSVLVVDDDADERQRLQQLAAAFRWEVDAVDVVDAMAALLADRTDAMPVCDCMLLGSQQTLTRLGEFLGDQPWPATILVPTSDAAVSAADPDRPRPDAVLHQPVEPALLFNAVNQVLVARGFDLQYLLLKTRIDSAQGQWLPGVRILVVDDSRLNLAVLERVLSLEGAHATLRESGEEALDTLRGEPLGFDLILMDLQMPGLDGCQTTELIRQEPRWRDLPILALTAGATDSEERRARDAGMDDFLLKPIDPVALVVALRMHIQRRLGHVLPVGLPLRRQPASVEVLALPVIAGLSTQDGLMRLGADAGLFIQQWDKTAREGVEVLASLHDAIAQADQARACAIAHKFRGQVASLGADALARGLAELETLGRAGQLRAEHLAALTTAFEAIRVPWLAWSAQHHARAAAAVAASAPEAEVAALTDDQVRLLVTDLEKRRFSALKHYRQQRAAWRQRLDAAAFSALDQAIEDTNFAAALAAIRPARTPD